MICVNSGISPATDFVVSQMLTFENKEWLEPRGASDGPVSDFKEKKNLVYSDSTLTSAILWLKI